MKLAVIVFLIGAALAIAIHIVKRNEKSKVPASGAASTPKKAKPAKESVFSVFSKQIKSLGKKPSSPVEEDEVLPSSDEKTTLPITAHSRKGKSKAVIPDKNTITLSVMHFGRAIPNSIKSFDLTQDSTLSLGRMTQDQARLAQYTDRYDLINAPNNVSRFHSVILFDPSKQNFEIVKDRPEVPTLVNGKEIFEDPVALHDGDLITMGSDGYTSVVKVNFDKRFCPASDGDVEEESAEGTKIYTPKRKAV